ncbi:hypothetical protein CEQ28_000860 [Hafnia alvei]|nr:hypothetical protein CEQ28_000860 [Hafnia alvei]
MKSFYVQQINTMLEDYYFNLENNPQGHDSHFSVLANGIQHLHGLAFCSRDTDTAASLLPFVMSVINGEVPAPVYVEVAA